MAAHQQASTSYLSDLDATPDLERLVRPHAAQLRDWYSHWLSNRPDAEDWWQLGEAIDRQLNRLWTDTVLSTEAGGKVEDLRVLAFERVAHVRAFLSQCRAADHHLAQFNNNIDVLYSSSLAWPAAIGTVRTRYWEFACVSWICALQGLKSGQTAIDFAPILESHDADLQDDPEPEHPSASVEGYEDLLHSPWAAMPTGNSDAAADHQDIPEHLTVADADLAERPCAPPPVPVTEATLAIQIEPVEPEPQPQAELAPVHEPARLLNGQALKNSAFGTWLGLVVLSWVSLVWGAAISLPFGIGIGIIAMLGIGFVAVPLWGTVFGLLGMQGASGSTLRSMKFAELGEDDPFFHANKAFAEQLDIPAPKIGTVEVYNAFAMGAHWNKATVALGQPLLNDLTDEEARAVLGHELGHVVSGDMRRMMLMRTFQNACVWYMCVQELKQFARWVISWVAELFILAFSRKREFWADAIGAALTSKDAMIGALRKLEAGPKLTEHENLNARFMCRGRANSLLSTHPSTEDRIAALEAETYLKQLPFR